MTDEQVQEDVRLSEAEIKALYADVRFELDDLLRQQKLIGDDYNRQIRSLDAEIKQMQAEGQAKADVFQEQIMRLTKQKDELEGAMRYLRGEDMSVAPEPEKETEEHRPNPPSRNGRKHRR